MYPQQFAYGAVPANPTIMQQLGYELNQALQKLMYEVQLSQQEHQMVMGALFDQQTLQQLAYSFQQNSVNPQNGYYNPAAMSAFAYDTVKGTIHNARLARSAPQQINQMPMQQHMGGGFGAMNPTMNYMNVGAKPTPQATLPPDTAYTRELNARATGVVQGNNYVATIPTPAPKVPDKPKAFENTFICKVPHVVNEVTTQTPENKTKMDELTIPEVQTCVTKRAFSDEKNHTYDYLHVKLHVPYSNKANALADFYGAYPELEDTDSDHFFVHLIEFNEMVPSTIAYDNMFPILNRIREQLLNNPFYCASGELFSMLPDPLIRGKITGDMIDVFNKLSAMYLSITNAEDSNKMPHLTISGLTDLNEIMDPNSEATQSFRSIEDFEARLLSVMKSLADMYFHVRTSDRVPYLVADSDEMVFIATHEASGIRIGNSVGRNFEAIQQLDDEELTKKFMHKLKQKTILLKKNYVVVTNADLPELSNPKLLAAGIPIANPVVTLHNVLGTIIGDTGCVPLTMEFLGSKYDSPSVSVGLSMTNQMIFKAW